MSLLVRNHLPDCWEKNNIKKLFIVYTIVTFEKNWMSRFIVILLLIFSAFSGQLFAQTGTIQGQVFNKINNEPLPFVNIIIEGTDLGTTSDLEGNFIIEKIPAGTYNVLVSYIGFQKLILYEVIVTSTKAQTLNIGLQEESINLKEIEISEKPFITIEESPLSIKTISAAEIYRNPGGNRDISKVIQSFPGVAGTVSFRNDIIIRGGAPNENRFYLDGIEVPNINHFATQGSSGGPVGLINVNFIREVDFFTGAFPANRGNSLSAVLEFKQIDGNKDGLAGTFALGSSDIGLTLNGPVGKKSDFIFSVRRSYLQFLFQALKLPFLPTYNDFQFKQNININKKNKITLIGLGAIDDFILNTKVNSGIEDSSLIERNNYILGNLPINNQWNYTGGIKWQHFNEKSYQIFVLSRNHLNNEAIKYINNIELDSNLILKYRSQEIENKFRFEHVYRNKGWKVNLGSGIEHSSYSVSTYQKRSIGDTSLLINFNSKFEFIKFALFGQVSKLFFNDRLLVSLGLRSDINTYSNEMLNPIEQLAPRLSLSYAIHKKWNLNISSGRYTQLPPYTVLGYRDSTDLLVNKENKIKYITCLHLVSGIEFRPSDYSKFTLEGFYKKYSNYPYLIEKGISLANLGGDFGVIGNEPASPESQGRSYGIEIFFQQKLKKKIYLIFSYTFVRSEFTNKNEKYLPSSWDNRHIFNMTGGYKLKKNWEVGAKFRLLGGGPYTPYNLLLSAQKIIWDVNQQGFPDYSKVNSERFPISHGLDIRIDKKWFFKKWSLNAYLDIQNTYNFQSTLQPYLAVQKDGNGNPITDSNNSNAYLLKTLPNTTGTVIPSIGIMIDF